ncbi:protein RIC-3b isoform X2 [Takifugu flavidus]|uniref:Protein RIC-3 n=1 Tax=Takifugu flavidus TaxID=433684 RepID=A0A5C6P8E7_9TELE|nr:protein RIC-3b isoform X2 [Takifugu flavidus]TWW76084.1 Protein RIC-3 [Takifugu flavidus]
MAMSTFQKVTLATCLVLCVALLLPKMLLSRGRKDAAERPDGLGHFPPMVNRQKTPDRAASAGFSRAHNTEAIARAKGAGTGAGAGGKSNLAGQIIPVYGFGILLYILYILFKITSKGNNKPPVSRFASVRSENLKRKITDFELAQLQEKLRETELVMENIVSNAHHSADRVKGVTADQEANLLQQLTEITRVMQEGHLVEEGPLAEEGHLAEEGPLAEEGHLAEEGPLAEEGHLAEEGPLVEEGPLAEEGHLVEEAAAPEQKSWEDYPEDPPLYWEQSERRETQGGRTQTGAPEPGVPYTESGEDKASQREEADAGDPLGVPEELARVLEELQLSLSMASVMEEEVGSLRGLVDQAGTARRRNKRRAKKAAH